MRLPLTAFCAAFAAAAVACAQTPAESELSFTLAPTYVSQYVFRGQRASGASFEPSIEADASGLALGVWCNRALQDKPAGDQPEIDPYGSYTFALSNVFSIQPGFTYYTHRPAPAAQVYYPASFEPNLALNYTVAGLKITPKVYHDVPENAGTYELNATSAVPLTSLGTELDFTGTIGEYYLHAYSGTPRVAVKAWGNYWLLGVAVPVQIRKNLKLIVGWAYTEGTDAYLKRSIRPKVRNPEAVGRGIVTVGLVYTF